MYDKMQVMKLFDILWKKITMDFIIKLLKLKNLMTKIFYDLIIIVVDKLMKYFYFILFKEIFDTKQLGHFFLIELYDIKIYHKILSIIKIYFSRPHIGQCQ